MESGDIEKLDDIESITVNWSESTLINDVLGCDDNSDINKTVDVDEFDKLIIEAAKKVETGYDKTNLTVKLKNGRTFASECKFNMTKQVSGLLDLLNNH